MHTLKICTQVAPYDFCNAGNTNGFTGFNNKTESTVKRGILQLCQNVDAIYEIMAFPTISVFDSD